MVIVMRKLREAYEKGDTVSDTMPEWFSEFRKFRWLVSTADDEIATKLIKNDNNRQAAAKAKSKATRAKTKTAKSKTPAEIEEETAQGARFFE